jgi:hypothetical protein
MLKFIQSFHFLMDSTEYSDLKRTLDNELNDVNSEILALDLQRQQLVERRNDVSKLTYFLFDYSKFRYVYKLSSWRMSVHRLGAEPIMKMANLIGTAKLTQR